MSEYFFDTEFSEDGPDKPVKFISIGIVSENGDKYYAVSGDFSKEDLNSWVFLNVIPKLDIPPEGRKPISQIKKEILEFIGDDKDPVFVADHAAYDWVVFCWMFG